MKTNQQHLIACAIGLLTLMGCKSSQQAEKGHEPAVSVAEFNHRNNPAYAGFKALILDESIQVEKIGLPGVPWERREARSIFADGSAWETVVTDKTLFLSNQVEKESFMTIDYANPLQLRWDLLRQCEMWLYSQKENGNIQKRKIKKEEIVRERLNDSICRVQLRIKEDLAGKVLVRTYKFLTPFNRVTPYYGVVTQEYKNSFLTPTELSPWTFQKEIPLLHGAFNIYMPYDEQELIKVGKGEMDIQHAKVKRSTTYFMKSNEANASGKGFHTKNAANTIQLDVEQTTATVTNVVPLPQGSSETPLGVRFVVKGKRK